MSDFTREEHDAKLDASEARTRALIERAMDKLDRVPTLWQVYGAVAGGFAAVAALMLSVLSYGGDRFDSGTGLGMTLNELRNLAQQNALQIQQITTQIQSQQRSIESLTQDRNAPPPNPH